MTPKPTTPDVRKADGNSFYWGDLVTLRLLLGACLLMWSVGLVHIVLRLWFR